MGGDTRGLAPANRKRTKTLLVVGGVAFAAIAVKLTYIQVVHARVYGGVANAEETRAVTEPALRGAILAANGDDLALSVLRSTIFADPGEIVDAGADAARLSPVLHRPAATIAASLTAPTTYVVLARGTSAAVADAVTKLDITGIGIQDDPVRYDPAGQLAAPLLGTVNAAGVGISGLEYQYDSTLTGTAGAQTEIVDPQGQVLPHGILQDRPTVPGDDIVTTLSETLQYQVEQALAQQISTTKASSGIAVVMDRRTGDLLAVADLTAGPNGTTVESPSAAAFTAVYQPGSVAKLVTVAGALAQRVITPTSTFTIPNGLPVGGTVIHDDEPHPTEQLSVTGILAQSSNVGAAEIGEQLGADRLYRYEQTFGFTAASAVHFPAESAGIVPTPSQFSGSTLATMSYGEAQAVTAIQLTAAYNTIANGGVYVAPRLVTGIIGPDGKEHLIAYPPNRRIVPSWVARAMTPMFEQVVSSGTGLSAAVPGYAVAGKTGTSNVIKADGRYSTSVTNSTFAGYYPAQDPAFTTVVITDGSQLYGAEAAAPAFSTIARDALLRMAIPPDGPQPPPAVTSVPVIDGQVDTALLGQ